MSEEEKKFENLFKNSFEDFEAEVNPTVWKNVQTGLKGVGLGVLIKTTMNKLGTNAIVAIVSSAATVLSTVLVMNWSSSPNKQIANNTHKTSPKTTVETPVPEKVEDIKNFLADKKEDVKAPVKNINETDEASQKGVTTNKKNANEMQSVINALSDQVIASINASTVGGAVPLIVNVSNSGNGKINKWDFGNGQKESGNNPVTAYDVPGIYTITLTSTSADGKTATDQIKVEVTGNSSLVIPESTTTISPNDDSINDSFAFKGEKMQEYNAIVFDGSKNIVFQVSKKGDFSGSWDGKDKEGKLCKSGVYYYIINAIGEDGKKYERKGKIKLER